MALTTFAITAQNKNDDRRENRKQLQENFTPEQQAELQTKKMTLDLDLNETQQTKVNQLMLDLQKDKPKRTESRKEMTNAQKFEARSAMLDRRIAMKKAMKEILTEEQFAKWEKNKQHRPRRISDKKGLDRKDEK
jgi:Spy/CpxP family protein refolding chaperone